LTTGYTLKNAIHEWPHGGSVMSLEVEKTDKSPKKTAVSEKC